MTSGGTLYTVVICTDTRLDIYPKPENNGNKEKYRQYEIGREPPHLCAHLIYTDKNLCKHNILLST